ncbi:fatty acyl-CoA reductase wat-like [Polistes fuscatus]|uniref:fatty acyl-CoA reductase wat-like n=1 Tax=Polistes fuscatus TaxID=30207 RepID=UPI001CA83A7C|nr:fatty acyl-CoA reductase wat-like [Polistes fuscatus]
MGFVADIYLGIVHTIQVDENICVDIILGDYVTNNIIVAAWDCSQRRLMNLYKKVYKFNHAMAYFTTHDWKFANDNVLNLWDKLSVSDKYNFFFNIGDLDRDAHNDVYIRRVRIFILKEPMETREKALIWYKKIEDFFMDKFDETRR